MNLDLVIDQFDAKISLNKVDYFGQDFVCMASLITHNSKPQSRFLPKVLVCNFRDRYIKRVADSILKALDDLALIL